ncbi:MAG: FAD-dependent monooxygenase [Anaerolineae bacterium]|nr:FAD-dependent monooxygenase [Anaerolineae bacterium]
MTENIDVLIVGGGPAGLSTWLHLHQKAPVLAARSIVIEKATYPRQKLCGGGVTRRADLTLGRLRIKIDVPAIPVHTVEVRFGSDTYYLRQRNIFRVVRRHEFDHALALSAIKRGLRLSENEHFCDFERVTDGVLVQTSRRVLKVRALVAADGAKSVVRAKMRLSDKTRMSRLLEVVTPIDVRGSERVTKNVAVLDFTSVAENLQGYVWDFPCIEAGVPCVNRGVFDSRVYPNNERADLKSIFSQALQQRQVDRPPQSWQGHPERWFSEKGIYSQANILLAGDAAGVEPAFGEGIAQALGYGDVAATTLMNAFHHQDFSFDDYRARLLAHPLGQSLKFQTRLAKKLYREGPDALAHAKKLLARWLSPV